MGSLNIGPGDDVEAWCGKCLMVLNHRVIAVVGNQIKKVECLTCHAIHAYKRGGNSAKSVSGASSSVPTSVHGSRSITVKPARAENEWKTFMADAAQDIDPRKYSIFESYKASEFIEHPSFGIGKVLEITGRGKMLVIFKEGRKTLIFNRS
ncbi:MAG: hypothetical protein ACP5VS_03640 [Desulfomonilaceae bacterium]